MHVSATERLVLLKIATDDEVPVDGIDEAIAREIDRNDDLFPQALWPILRRVFTPRGMPFFDFYITLKRINLGAPIGDTDLRREYVVAANRLAQVTSPQDHRPLSPEVVNLVAESRTDLGTLLGRLMAGRTEDPATWRRINDIYVPLLQAVTKDKGIYLSARQLGTEKWGLFRRMNQQQEKIERLRDDDPESYALVKQFRETRDRIDAQIVKKIESAGLLPRKDFLAGRPVMVGQNPVTGEESIYDTDGDVLDRDAFFEKRKQKAEADQQLFRMGNRTTLDKDQEIRFISDDRISELTGDVEWTALTDDKAKQGRLTRLFTTKWMPLFVSGPDGVQIESTRVITSGRFKGAYLNDMVNASGRLVEGTAYSYNPLTGRSGKVPQQSDPGQREPYVTVAETVTTRREDGHVVKRKTEKLFIKVPGTHPYKEIRKALKSLACNAPGVPRKGCIPSLIYQAVEGSNAASFTFEPKDFAAIRDAVQGMALSQAALDLIQNYYRDLSRADQATAEKNLTMYSAESLGGFKTHKKDPVTGEMKQVDLLVMQKKALAWLDANGNRGVCALDTGIGKTLTSIGMMQKLGRDGLAEADASYWKPDGTEVSTNGRYLFVCPPKLKGNFSKEVRGFISDPRVLLDKVDVISFREFGGSYKSKKVPTSIRSIPFWKNREWDPALYVAIFFDEAHVLSNTSSAASQAALMLFHPRKICLTASPMEDNPMQAYVLAAVSNNTPLFGQSTDADTNRTEMRRFKDRFCETVGGHIVGVKQEATTKRDLQTWVKRNIYYADKTQVVEPHASVPTLQASTTVVEMPQVVEDAYRSVSGQFAAVLGGLVTRYQFKGKAPAGGPSGRDPDIDKFFTMSFMPVIQLLNALSNYPGEALIDLAAMVRTGYMPLPGRNGDPRPIPKVILPVVEALRAKFSADQLMEMGARTGNPKLEAASDFIKRKLDRSQDSARTLIFSDDKRLCAMAARHMAQQIAGWHVLALGDEIRILEGSQEVPSVGFEITPEVLSKTVSDPDEQMRIMQESGGWSIITLPIRQHVYRRFPMLPAKDPDNTHYKADQWPQFAFREIITPNPQIKSCTLLGPAYSHGQNLQSFDTVIHLDRDTWDSEAMKQRTARAWRQGQTNPVDEVTIDATYGASDGGVPRDEFDKTLDEIRRLIQDVDADIFNQIIKDSQDLALGKEWLEVVQRGASHFNLDKKVMELMTSPFVGRSQPPGGA